MANTPTGVTRIIKAAGDAWKGLCAAWRYEAAFRQECILVLSALIISFWLDVNSVTRVLLIGSAMMVIIVEIINSQLKQLLTELVQNITNYQAEQKIAGQPRCLVRV